MAIARKIKFQRRLPIGAEPIRGGGTHFRVWAPKSKRVRVEFGERDLQQNKQEIELTRESKGYFAGRVKSAAPGMLYRFKLHRGSFPDPGTGKAQGPDLNF